MGKNVAVFVDVANIFYAAKAAGVDIDYVTLLKGAIAGRDFVRAYAYTGLDPDNENQRNFHSFLMRNDFRVVSKDIRKYGDGKVKANLDIELVVDMMKTARNLDVAIIVSGDGDFAPAIRAVQEMGVRVEVISFRGNTSSDLIEAADQFTDITQLAKVEKGSSRSGRRVAGDDEDLSMTEVPDKLTEGTGRTRGRGRGRGRGEEVAASRPRRSTAAAAAAPTSAPAAMTVMPGERLSRVASEEDAAAPAGVEDEILVASDVEGTEEEDESGRRRRRRRGGRGRGRGRGRADEALAVGETVEPVEAGEEQEEPEPEAEPEPEPVAASAGRRPSPFGSIWDSQLGVSSRTTSSTPSVRPAPEEDDFEEPEIPEYLIAEQRRGAQGGRDSRGGGRGGRGGGGARAGYAAAVDRERYGRGMGAGGINRYPDTSRSSRGPQQHQQPRREDRPAPPPPRQGQGSRGGGGRSSDPWSEVPPEIEEMLKAQLAQSPASRPAPSRAPTSAASTAEAAAAPIGEAEQQPAAPTRGRGRRRTNTTSEGQEPTTVTPIEPEAGAEPAAPAATTRRTTRRKATGAVAAGSGSATPASDGAAEAAPKRRTTRRRTTEPAPEAIGDSPTATAAPAGDAPTKRRTRRTTSSSAGSSESAPATTSGNDTDGDVAAAATATPRRRSTRRKASETAES